MFELNLIIKSKTKKNHNLRSKVEVRPVEPANL